MQASMHLSMHLPVHPQQWCAPRCLPQSMRPRLTTTHAAAMDAPTSSYTSEKNPAPSDQRKRYNRKRDTSGKKDKAQQKRYNINKQLFAASNKDRIGTILAQQASVFDADNISVAMHCLGHSKRPEEATIAEVFKLAEDNLDQLLPHHLAVCVWAMARVRRPQQPLLNNVLSRLESQLHALHAQQLCKLLWALGTMRHDPGQHFMDATAEQCLRRINDLQPQGITNIMWSLARLHCKQPTLVQALCDQAASQCAIMTPQGLANFVWALATMQERAPKGLLVDIEAAAVAQMQQSSPQSLANTLWALSSLDHEPVALLTTLAAAPDAYLLHCIPRDTHHVLFACARAGFYDAVLVDFCLKAALDAYAINPQCMSVVDLAGIVHSLGKLEACPPQHVSSLASVVAATAPEMRSRALATVVWGMARLSHAVSWDDDLVSMMLKMAKDMSFDKPQHMTNVAWAAATLRHRRSPSTIGAMLASIQHLVARCKVQELCIVLWSCALHNVGREGFASRGRGRGYSNNSNSSNSSSSDHVSGDESSDPGLRKAHASKQHVQKVLQVAWLRFAEAPKNINEQDVALLLWSQARLRHGHVEGADWGAMASWLMEHVEVMDPRQLAMVAWAIARLRTYMQEDTVTSLFESLEQCAQKQLHNFAPLDLANMIHAFGRIQYFPSTDMLDLCAKQVTSKVDFFLTEELANTLWGFAALNYHPGPLVGLVARKAQQERVSGWQLKTLTWCYTVFQFKDA